MSFQPPRRPEQTFVRDITDLLLRYFLDKDESVIDDYADQVAERMITGLYVSNARSWREASRKSMQGARIYQSLSRELRGPVGRRMRELVAENARLIKSLPLDISTVVTREVARAAMTGQRATSFEQIVPRVARWKAHLIARTETSKATTALTQARAENLDLPFYVWRSSEDQRVRLSHRKMNGVVIPWRYAPDPERLVGERAAGHYHAGNIYNCRCYPEPLMRLDQVSWPHRVFWDGRIISMTLSSFRKIALQHQPLAA